MINLRGDFNRASLPLKYLNGEDYTPGFTSNAFPTLNFKDEQARDAYTLGGFP